MRFNRNQSGPQLFNPQKWIVAVPRYSFEFQKRNGVEVVEDVELAGLDAVRQEAAQTAREIMVDGILSGADRTEWITNVRDSQGTIVLSFKFSDLLDRD
jgi:hypothetical protein